MLALNSKCRWRKVAYAQVETSDDHPAQYLIGPHGTRGFAAGRVNATSIQWLSLVRRTPAMYGFIQLDPVHHIMHIVAGQSEDDRTTAIAGLVGPRHTKLWFSLGGSSTG